MKRVAEKNMKLKNKQKWKKAHFPLKIFLM